MFKRLFSKQSKEKLDEVKLVTDVAPAKESKPDIKSREYAEYILEETARTQAISLDLSHIERRLSGNYVRQLLPRICQLTHLTSLNLSGNLISELPSEIQQLEKLTSLNIESNNLKILPPEIGLLTNLTELKAAGNSIYNLPPSIGMLENLVTLDLGTKMRPDYSLIEEDEEPEYESNSIKALPPEMINLKNLQTLDLSGNPLDIPPEILEKKNDAQLILNYYYSLHQTATSSKAIQEAKLLILGQGSVGKTSLIQKILFGRFNENELKTNGISILRWMIKGKHEISDSIRLNTWDFGGQEIMHATHQFFLTKRSIYLLVLDSRLTSEENRVEYWLKIIQSFGGESPVLIVGNKIDQHPLDIDRTGLQKKYPNIVGILETSAATGRGIEALKAAIAEQVNNLPHVHDLLPETWFNIKRNLEELKQNKNYFNYDEYIKLCVENKVKNEISQRTLLSFLHDLGVVLHFQDDPRLESLGILNPQWVTNGVYKILNSHEIFADKGVLNTYSLGWILKAPDYHPGTRLFIVEMMKKFELCYEMPFRYGIESDKTFLVPDLLPKDEPTELKFNGVPAFEYAYPVLPSSVITRFIVRMNQKIDDGLVWRTGVVLKIGENKALVKADIEDRKITIAIEGVEHTRRDALSAIRYELGEIHNSIKGLNPQQRVPVPNAPLAEPLKYEYLLKLERAGQETVLVENGNDLVTVNVRQMLSAIESETTRKDNASKVTNIYIHGDVKDSNIVAGDHDTVERS